MLASDSARMGVCLALALLPIGNAVVMRTITWTFWPWLLGSVLLCAVPSAPGKVGLVVETSYLALSACSSPVSIILLPHLGWRSLKARNRLERVLFITLCILTLGYLFTVDRTGRASASYTVRHVVPAFADRVLFEGFWTNWLRMRLIWRGLHGVVVLVGIAMGVLAAAAMRLIPQCWAATRQFKGTLLRLSIVWLGLTLLVIYSRFGPGGLDYRQYFHHRYFWIQQYTVWLVALVVIFHALRLDEASTTRRAAAFAVLIGYITVTGYLDRQEFTFLHAEGRPTRAFLDTVYECERAKTCQMPIRFDKADPEWTIVVSPAH